MNALKQRKSSSSAGETAFARLASSVDSLGSPEASLDAPFPPPLVSSEKDSTLVSLVKAFDLFPKVSTLAYNMSSSSFSTDIVQSQTPKKTRIDGTSFGGLLSIPCVMVLLWLGLSELWSFVNPSPQTRIKVDTMYDERLSIYLDIEFPFIPCVSLGLDVMDVTGEQQVHVYKTLSKTRIDARTGKIIGKDDSDEQYNLEMQKRQQVGIPPWFQTMIAGGLGGGAQRASQALHNHKKEGCRIRGEVKAQKVSGNFHLALGMALDYGGRHVHQFSQSDIPLFDTTHYIHGLSFGPHFPLQSEPLHNFHAPIPDTLKSHSGSATYQYKLKVIPTLYQSQWGFHTYSHQFTYSLKTIPVEGAKPGQRPSGQLPGVFFIYELTPFMVMISQKRPSLFEFIIHLGAIAGGFYAVFQMFDSVVFNFVFEKGRQMISHLSPANTTAQFEAVL